MTKNFEQKDHQEELFQWDKDILDNIKKGKKKHGDGFPEKAEKSMEKTISDAESYNKILEQKAKYEKKLISADEYIDAMKNSPLYKKIPEIVRKEIEEERNNTGKKESLSDKQVISFMELMLQDPNFVDKIMESAQKVNWDIQEVRILWNQIVLIGEHDKKAIPFFYPWNIFRNAAQLWNAVVKRVCTDHHCAMRFPKKREVIWVRRREWLNRTTAKFEKPTPTIETDMILDRVSPIKPAIETVKNQEIWLLSFAVAEADTGEKIDNKTIQWIKELPENSTLTVEASVDYRQTAPEKQLTTFNDLIKTPLLADLIANKKIDWFEETRKWAFKEASEKRGNALLGLNRALRLINEMAIKTGRNDIRYKINTMEGKKPIENDARKNMTNDQRETILGKDRFARFTADIMKTKESELDLSSITTITNKITKDTKNASILITLPATPKMLVLDHSKSFSDKMFAWRQKPENQWVMNYLKTNYWKEAWTRQFFQFAQSVGIIWKNLVDKGIDPVKQKITFLKTSNTEDPSALTVSLRGRNETTIQPPKNPYLNENLAQK